MRKIKAILISNASVFEVFKNIIEIVALIIAATWALYNFEIKDAPTLEKSASSHCELHIDSLNSQKNLASFIVHMRNIGKTSFDVDSVRISYWLVPMDTMLQNNYFSAESYMHEKKPNFSIVDFSFSFHYAPDKECIERYNFILDNKPDNMLLIKADFSLQGRKGFFSKDRFPDDTYTFLLHATPGKK